MSKIDRIIMIVDRSGSMGSLAVEASGGINSFITQQKADDRKAHFQFIEFDDQIDASLIKEIHEASDKYELKPRGMTAMLDAIGTGLNKEALKLWPGHSDYDKNICIIVTDGHENASKEYDWPTIGLRIQALEKKGWEFVFMASNLDAEQMKQSLGSKTGASITLNHTEGGMNASYMASTAYVGNLRHSGKAAADEDLALRKRMSSDIS
jgi:Mg-chelatase subunit ChlD